MNEPAFYQRLLGTWTGHNKLWLNPTEPVRECSTTASVESGAGQNVLTLRYAWTESGTPQEGVMLVRIKPAADEVAIVWADSWHMNDRFMLCKTLSSDDSGVSALGSFPAPPGPDWGWRISLTAESAARFVLRMYIITPDHQEMLAVEGMYSRVTND